MRHPHRHFGLLCAAALFLLSRPVVAQTLDIYFIDVEGGEATLIVAPNRQAMLIDTGWDGFDNRDAERIVAVARQAGIETLDYLLVTHFHRDHVGGAPEVVRRLPVKTFVDYGVPIEEDEFAQKPFAAYATVRATGAHHLAKPQQRLALGQVEITIVSAAGNTIRSPLEGTPGGFNAACPTRMDVPTLGGENPRSVGIQLRFGQFTFVDLGDLAGPPLIALTCPNNLLGQADVYLVPHHGNVDTAIPAVIAGIAPRVAIINNGATKGGDAPTFSLLRDTRGLEDVWQLHRSENKGALNFPDEFIANLAAADPDRGAWIKISADSRGHFSVTNSRTGFTKSYE